MTFIVDPGDKIGHSSGTPRGTIGGFMHVADILEKQYVLTNYHVIDTLTDNSSPGNIHDLRKRNLGSFELMIDNTYVSPGRQKDEFGLYLETEESCRRRPFRAALIDCKTYYSYEDHLDFAILMVNSWCSFYSSLFINMALPYGVNPSSLPIFPF